MGWRDKQEKMFWEAGSENHIVDPRQVTEVSWREFFLVLRKFKLQTVRDNFWVATENADFWSSTLYHSKLQLAQRYFLKIDFLCTLLAHEV